MSKYLFLVPSIMALTACGAIVNEPIDFPSPTPTVTVTATPSPSPVAEAEPATLEGYFVLPDGGYLDMYEDSAGTVSLRNGRIVVRNTDGTTGLLPLTTFTQLAKLNQENKVSYIGNQTYVALTHNIKSNNSAIAGSYTTQVIISKNDRGLLQLNIIISNNATILAKFEVIE